MTRWIVPFLLAAAYACGLRMREARGQAGLTQAELPPGQAAGAALLGGFRGLYVDYLWCRVEGQFMEAKPPLHEIPGTYRLIGQLQPRYPELWIYTSFRLALDAAAVAPDRSQESDWTWTRRGIDHLKEGLLLNPSSAKLKFSLAELYHRRCAPHWSAPHGDYARQQLLKERGEDAYERAVTLIHEIRGDPETLPSWLGTAVHVRAAQALEARTPEEEDLHLAQMAEEHLWIIRLYEDPAPSNRWIRENPAFYREQATYLRRDKLEVLSSQREALRLEAAGKPGEAERLWMTLMRRALLNTLRPDPLSEKHLRAMGSLARTYAALADEFEQLSHQQDPQPRQRLESLVRTLREEAGRSGKDPHA